MVSDDIGFLHEFAQRIGIKKCWYQNKRGKSQPHYDVRAEKLPLALKEGAVQVSSKEIVEFLRKHYS